MKRILVTMVTAAFLLFPFAAKAEGKVKVYLFRGEGCPHCEEAVEFFGSLESDVTSRFELIQYEVWNDEANNQLMKDVASKLDDEVSGVPYIVVGDQTFHGYTDEIGEEIVNTINEYYENGVFIDVLDGMTIEKTNNNNDAIIVGVFVAVVVIGAVLVVLARKKM